MIYRRTINIIVFLITASLLLFACATQPATMPVIHIDPPLRTEISEPDYDKKIDSIQIIKLHLLMVSDSFNAITEELGIAVLDDFYDWIIDNFGVDTLCEFADAALEGEITADTLRAITGYGLHAFNDLYNGRLDIHNENYLSNIINLGFTDDGVIKLGFVGDVSLADNWKIMPKYDSRGKGISGILSDEIVEIMKSVDVMVANNEFALSDRGAPIPRKAFTFRGTPSRVDIWHEMGVDLVTLANNHVYDFGEDAFLDTLEALDNAGIARMGAGRDIEEASRPVYYIINGYKIAFVAGTRAEKNIFTPEAKLAGEENSSGVLRTYDSALLCAAIEQAKKQSDFVIVNVHWGAEHSTVIEHAQITMGKQYIDSGADLIIGHHAHNLQGFDSYKGKIIAYNLGNFIFNNASVSTGILVARINTNGELTSEFIPGYQQNCYTRLSVGSEYESILKHLRSISFKVDISENGAVTPK